MKIVYQRSRSWVSSSPTAKIGRNIYVTSYCDWLWDATCNIFGFLDLSISYLKNVYQGPLTNWYFDIIFFWLFFLKTVFRRLPNLPRFPRWLKISILLSYLLSSVKPSAPQVEPCHQTLHLPSSQQQKGVTKKKTRPPETFKCSKSKTWKPRKLKLHQPVYPTR